MATILSSDTLSDFK